MASCRLLPGPPCDRSAAGVFLLVDISAILLITLISRIHCNIVLASLLIDIAMPRLGGVRSKVARLFNIILISRPFVAPACGWDRRQMLFRHDVLRLTGSDLRAAFQNGAPAFLAPLSNSVSAIARLLLRRKELP